MYVTIRNLSIILILTFSLSFVASGASGQDSHELIKKFGRERYSQAVQKVERLEAAVRGENFWEIKNALKKVKKDPVARRILNGNKKLSSLLERKLAFHHQLERARAEIRDFKKALRSKNPERIKECVFRIQQNNTAKRLLNLEEKPWVREKYNEHIQKVVDRTLEYARKKLAQKYGVPEKDVVIEQITNPSSQKKVKVGQDRDITIYIKHEGQMIPVPAEKTQELIDEGLHRQAPDQIKATKSSKELARDMSFQGNDYLSPEAYGASPKEGEAIIGHTEKYIRDPQQVAMTMEYKHNEAYNEALELREKAAKLKKSGRYKEANELLGKAEEQVREAMRQTVKQFDKHVKPRFEKANAKFNEHVEKGIEIMRQVADGKISPAEGERLLRRMGETSKTITQKVAGQFEALEKERLRKLRKEGKIEIENPSEENALKKLKWKKLEKRRMEIAAKQKEAAASTDSASNSKEASLQNADGKPREVDQIISEKAEKNARTANARNKALDSDSPKLAEKTKVPWPEDGVLAQRSVPSDGDAADTVRTAKTQETGSLTSASDGDVKIDDALHSPATDDALHADGENVKTSNRSTAAEELASAGKGASKVTKEIASGAMKGFEAAGTLALAGGVTKQTAEIIGKRIDEGEQDVITAREVGKIAWDNTVGGLIRGAYEAGEEFGKELKKKGIVPNPMDPRVQVIGMKHAAKTAVKFGKGIIKGATEDLPEGLAEIGTWESRKGLRYTKNLMGSKATTQIRIQEINKKDIDWYLNKDRLSPEEAERLKALGKDYEKQEEKIGKWLDALNRHLEPDKFKKDEELIQENEQRAGTLPSAEEIKRKIDEKIRLSSTVPASSSTASTKEPSVDEENDSPFDSSYLSFQNLSSAREQQRKQETAEKMQQDSYAEGVRQADGFKLAKLTNQLQKGLEELEQMDGWQDNHDAEDEHAHGHNHGHENDEHNDAHTSKDSHDQGHGLNQSGGRHTDRHHDDAEAHHHGHTSKATASQDRGKPATAVSSKDATAKAPGVQDVPKGAFTKPKRKNFSGIKVDTKANGRQRLSKSNTPPKRKSGSNMSGASVKSCPRRQPGRRIRLRIDTNNDPKDRTYLYCTYNRSGILTYECPIVSGKKNGICKSYYGDTNTLYWETSYKYGVYHGFVRNYDRNGNKIAEWKYENGKLLSLKYYNNGRLTESFTYKNGKMASHKVYSKN